MMRCLGQDLPNRNGEVRECHGLTTEGRCSVVSSAAVPCTEASYPRSAESGRQGDRPTLPCLRELLA